MRTRGFTLLEVLVSVAILGLGLTAILSAQAGSFESAAHARNISVATGLLRCKMSEIEVHLYKEGFQETDETGVGSCCEGDETPNMRCTWRSDRPTFPEAKFGDLNLSSALNLGGPAGAGSANPLGALGMLAGAGGPSPLGGASSIGDVAKTLADANSQAASAAPPPASTSSLSGSSSSGQPGGADMGGGGAMGGLASLAMSFVYPTLKTLFEASTRRVTVSLTFREGKKEYTIDVVEWFSVPQKGLAAADDSISDSSSSSSGSGTGAGAGKGSTSGSSPGVGTTRQPGGSTKQ